MPTNMSTPCQIKNTHGNVQVTANSLGFARVYMGMGIGSGQIVAYNDATHTETVRGASAVLLATDPDAGSGPS